MDDKLWSEFGNRVNHVREVINGRLELYWDVPEDYPVVEIFIYGLEKEVDNKCEEIRNIFKSLGITNDVAEVVSKELEVVYHRVDVYFEKDISDEDLNTVVEVLQRYGDRDYSYRG